jgi:hypothetical protein
VSVIICINDIPYVYELNENYDAKNRFCNYFNKIRNIKEPVLLDINYLERYEGHCYHYKYKGNAIHQSDNFIKANMHKKLMHAYNYKDAYYDYTESRDSLNITYATCCSAVADFLKCNNIINNNYTSIMFTPKTLFNVAVCGNSNYENTPTLIKNHFSIYKQ